MFVICFYTQVCFLVLLPSLLTHCTVMDHFKFRTYGLSPSKHVLATSYRTRNPLRGRICSYTANCYVNSTFRRSSYLCFMFTINSINWLRFVMETQRVYCQVGGTLSHVNKMDVRPQPCEQGLILLASYAVVQVVLPEYTARL